MKDRDIKLLIGLGIVAVLVLPYILLVIPKNDQIEAVEAEIVTLTERYTYLNGLNANRQAYLDGIEDLNGRRDTMVTEFAPGLRRENTIMFLVDAEDNIPLYMKTLSFSEGEDVNIAAANEEKEALIGKNATTVVSYYGEYESVKKMLSHVQNYDERMVISSIDISLDEQTLLLKGTFTLQQYAITGQGKELPPAEIPEMEHGNKNIFVPFQEETDVPVEGNDYECDYFLLLKPKGTEGGTKILGKSGDGTGNTQLVNSSNSEQSMRVTFNSEGGKNYVSYAIGTVKYPIENYELGEEFSVDDGVINFKIISSAREEGDVVGANIKFINNTDLPLVVTVIDDDEVEPRVNVTETSGDVTVE